MLVPMAGLIDAQAELARLGKQLEKLAADLAKSENKLANENFVNNAPEAVVAKERARVDEMQGAMTRIREQIETMKTLVSS